MNTTQKTTIMLFAAIIAAGAAFADAKVETPAAVTVVSADEIQEFQYGGDFRFRTVYFDNIPYSEPHPLTGSLEAREGINSFQRYRTRVWGEYHPKQNENIYLRGRLVNEWRSVQEPTADNGWSAFDETIFDNLFVDYKTDLFDVRVGRQDLIYGTGKIILDGTPLDGSRTIYFDAAKVTYKGIENTMVDFLAMYTESHDPLAIHSQDRSLVGLTGGYDGVEAGGGVYVKNNGCEDLPWEAYFLTKTKQQLFPTASEIDDPINTVGMRLMPKIAEGLTGNLEMAYQSTPDTSEFMIDALIKWQIKGMEDQKANVGLGWYHLSEDWNPIFARWPQYSELYVYSFDTTGAGEWKNISMPHVDFSIAPMKNYKADLLLGYMFAPENNGPGGSDVRGLLFTWWNKFTIKEQLLTQKDKLTGHVLFELMQPGAYYNADQRDHTATFFRVELNYAF